MGEIQNCEKIPRPDERFKGGQKMRFITIGCHLCQKKIIKLVVNENEDENLMKFCRKHFKYICKNCERILGVCHRCLSVFCNECKVYKPDKLRILCEDCYTYYLTYEKKDK